MTPIATLVMVCVVLALVLLRECSKRRAAEQTISRDISLISEKRTELEMLWKQTEDLKKKLFQEAKSKQELEAWYRQENQGLQKLLRDSEHDIARLWEKINQYKERLRSAPATAEEWASRTARYTQELKVARENFEAIRERLDAETSKRYQIEVTLRDTEAECRGMAIQIQDLQEEVSKCRQTEEAVKYAKAKYQEMVAQVQNLQEELKRHRANLEKVQKSNLTSMPWLAGMMADFLTYDYEVEAKKLEWGKNIQRQKKVASIREIRAETRERIAKAKEAVYQLEYLRTLFPGIDDVLATDYQELQLDGKIPDHDPVRDYLSREEWVRLSDVERDQLALDRYIASRQKSNWQIGRDYELSVAYEYSQQGYQVDTFGSYMGLEDLGRDLIAKKGDSTLIIQCKYWSQSKTIHEKHIYQLYGTMIGYCIEKNIPPDRVAGMFVTNIQLSSMARKVADYLGLACAERHPMANFPRIKCNIGKGEYGKTKIFHLPMDQQYDATKISEPGEFYAFTVQEAVDAGFRRAFRWHGGE